VAQKVSVARHKRLESLGTKPAPYAGFKGSADMLNQMEPGNQQKHLENIEKRRSENAWHPQSDVHFENLIGVPRGIGNCSETGQENAGACPAGAGEELKNLIFKCM